MDDTQRLDGNKGKVLNALDASATCKRVIDVCASTFPAPQQIPLPHQHHVCTSFSVPSSTWLAMTRQLLSSIQTLTFYDNELTAARRGKPIPQLTCQGPACKLYKPEVVRCKNAGGEGVDIDWTCEADLPEVLRFGRVEVGCEGWSGPGDPYVYKESCGLEYRLVHIPGTLSDDQYDPFASRSHSTHLPHFYYPKHANL
ncbi:DUF1183-domain-containing protein [Peniophora sp. CONT]|nr:DUF1183-domain-containing protein [Peniophora sp. CONT]